MIVFGIVLVAGIATAVVGLLTWAICTQHRDPCCAHLRIRRRLQVKVRPVTLDAPATFPGPHTAS
jgi:hypothetical protein